MGCPGLEPGTQGLKALCSAIELAARHTEGSEDHPEPSPTPLPIPLDQRVQRGQYLLSYAAQLINLEIRLVDFDTLREAV